MTETNTLDFNLQNYPVLADLPLHERQERRAAQLGILTRMTLELICEMSHDEADDGVKARLIQGGIKVAQEVRKLIG